MRSRLRHILPATIAVALVALFALGHGAPIERVVAHLGDLRPVPVLLGVLVAALAMVNRGWMNQVAHEAVGLDTGSTEMTRAAAVGFAAQKLVKSGGAAGLAVFVRHGRRRGHAAGSVIAACVLTAAAAFLALGGLLAITIVTLAATGRLTGWWIAASIGFGVYTVIVSIAAVVLVRSRPAAAWCWNRVQRLRRRPQTHMPTGWFDALDVGRRRPAVLVRLLGHAVLGKLLGALILATAVASTGLDLGPTDALIVYATALAASMVSIVPGGVGVVEGSLVALLVAGGAAAAPAALAVAVFRLFDLWLPVLAGALAARGEWRLDRADVEADAEVGHAGPVPTHVDRPVPALAHVPVVAKVVAA